MANKIVSVRVAYPLGQSSESFLLATNGWTFTLASWEGLAGMWCQQVRNGKANPEARWFVPQAGLLSVHVEEVDEKRGK